MRCIGADAGGMAFLFLRGQPLSAAEQPTPIRAVLFDKDGTMSNSEPHLSTLAIARIRHCLELGGRDQPAQLDDLLRRAYGLLPDGALDPAGITAVAARDHNLISTAVALSQVGHGWPDALALAEASFALADRELQHQPRGTPATDGLSDLLDAMLSLGLQLAVISNDDRQGIQAFLEHHGYTRRISAIWSAEDRPRKPDPQAIHHLCDRLGVAPQQCALVGDANSDLRMAKSAGVAVVLGYRGGWQRPVQLEAEFPLLDHWGELSLSPDPEPAEGVSTIT